MAHFFLRQRSAAAGGGKKNLVLHSLCPPRRLSPFSHFSLVWIKAAAPHQQVTNSSPERLFSSGGLVETPNDPRPLRKCFFLLQSQDFESLEVLLSESDAEKVKGGMESRECCENHSYREGEGDAPYLQPEKLSASYNACPENY